MSKGFSRGEIVFWGVVSQKSRHQIPEFLLHISTEGFKRIRCIVTPSRGMSLGACFLGWVFSEDEPSVDMVEKGIPDQRANPA